MTNHQKRVIRWIERIAESDAIHISFDKEHKSLEFDILVNNIDSDKLQKMYKIYACSFEVIAKNKHEFRLHFQVV